MDDQVDTGASAGPIHPASSPKNAKLRPKRVLACVLCQQRKVKCDRNFPCANCKRNGVQCVSAVIPQPRRRRFAERELLDRLQQYEQLLRENHIDFKPMHTPNSTVTQETDGVGSADLDNVGSTGEVVIESTGRLEPAVDFLQAVRKTTMEPDEEPIPHTKFDQHQESHTTSLVVNTSTSNDWLANAWRYPSHMDKDDYNRWFLFGEPQPDIDISSLHPDQAQILRLWQIYLENVDPMLKCTHNPTLQARIIDALGHMTSIPPLLNALMFSIYCVAIMSLADEDCLVRFGTSRQDMLAQYHGACQHALLKYKIWRSSELDGLTALYFYLVSLRPNTDPRSISAILAILIRNAQQMGLHDEASNTKHPVLEAELRRRVWWSLIALDHRVCELVEYKTSSLTPLWDCRLPLNVSDFELRAELKTSPAGHERPTEALFPVVWSQVADSLRHSAFHLNFINPGLNALCRSSTITSEGGQVEGPKAMIEKYLSYCEPDDPLGFTTIWMARGQVARHHLLAYYAKHSKGTVQQTESQRRTALSHAIDMLECDTKLRTSPLAKRHLWFSNFHVPAIAYFHIINHTRKQPNESSAGDVWRVMRENWSARAANRASLGKRNEQMTFERFSQSVTRGWEAFGAALRGVIEDEVLEKGDSVGAGPSEGSFTAEAIDVHDQMLPEDDLFGMGSEPESNVGRSQMGSEMVHFWTAMDWTFMDPQNW